MFEVQINIDTADRVLGSVLAALSPNRKLMQQIAVALEDEVEANFDAQGRPTKWKPLAKSTTAARLKRNKGSGALKILQDRGLLAASVSSAAGDDYAMIGAGRAYAAIQHFGGDVNIPAQSRKTRLRTDRKGNLLRQGDKGRKKNLAVFAKDDHKNVKETWSEVRAHSVHIPARPFLPFTGLAGAPTLQSSAEQSILAIISRAANDGLR